MSRLDEVLDRTLGVVETSQQIVERAGKVDYWRNMPGGHRVGFRGKPGSGMPVTGNPHVVSKLRGGKGKGKGKAKGKKKGKR